MLRADAPSHLPLGELRKQVTACLRGNQLAEAKRLSEQITKVFPTEPDGWVFQARVAQRESNYRDAAQFAGRAVEHAPQRLDVHLVQAECAIYAGQIAQAIETLKYVQSHPACDEDMFMRTSRLYTQLGRHQAAYDCAVAAQRQKPNSVNLAYLVASAAIALGKMDEAEMLLDKIISITPEEGDTYYNRSTLRKQTDNSNHIDAIKARITRSQAHDPRLAPLHYALGKELEDLGQAKDSFLAYAKGAAARRAKLAYKVEDDVETANILISTFSEDWNKKIQKGPNTSGPIFILGLPRSGTTLVDRIVSAHPQVSSLGEVNDVAYGVIRAGYPASSKSDLIRQSAKSDMQQLGENIWTAFQGYGENTAFLIDKTPANFLYLGLIAKALPNARIIHMKRHPMASGYAMFKVLFRMGYPFSYDLEDIGDYYVAYHRLMAHWHRLFPGRILDVQYEALIDDQERCSRQIINHCGLSWDEACLNFHQNAAPTATASAAQVRRPLYRDARDLWRQHEDTLQPLAHILEKEGISCR